MVRALFLMIWVAGCYKAPPPLGSSSGGSGGTTGIGGISDGGTLASDLAERSMEGVLLFRAQTSLVGTGALLALADFDGDRRLDAALLPAMGNVGNMLLGASDGTFRPGASFSVDGTAKSLLAGDFNGDARADLIATLGDLPGNNVTTLAGRGDGTFNPPMPLSSEAGAVAAAVGDFNADLKLDLAVVNETAGSVAIFLAGQSFYTAYPVTGTPRVIVTGDFNGDGGLDLVVGGGSVGTGTLDVLLAAGGGRFTTGTRVQLTAGVRTLVAARLNADARLDLVIGDQMGAVQPMLGNGDATFAVGAPLGVGAAVVALRAADLNGGGIVDLAVMAGRTLLVLLGRGDGTFGAGTTITSLNGVGELPDLLQIGDLNLDGKPDLVVAHGPVEVFLNLSN